MDPLTALANLVAELTKLTTAVIGGQTPEQKKQIWDWYIEDVARWRKLFRLDEKGRDAER